MSESDPRTSAGMPGPASAPRRLVAGLDGQGNATLVTDERMPRFATGGAYETWAVWGSDAPQLDTAVQAWRPTLFPLPGGVRFFISEIPPDHGPVDIGARMHSSETLDFAVILSGTVHLVQGDGTDITLVEGDCLVQPGTVHAWHNPGQENARIAFILLGVERKPDI